MIDLHDYTKFNNTVDLYDDSMKPVIYILGLVGELGEYCNKYKKIFRDKGGIMKKRDIDVGLELGDVAWYLERLCNEQGFSMEEIYKMNREKLEKRKANKTIQGDGDDR